MIVDRDGTTAYAVAGLLGATVPGRSIRILSGGTAAFWRDVEAVGGAPLPAKTPASDARPGATPGPAPVAPAAPTTPTAPSAPKKRPAGC